MRDTHYGAGAGAVVMDVTFILKSGTRRRARFQPAPGVDTAAQLEHLERCVKSA